MFPIMHTHIQGGPKNGLFFRVDNFATVSDRKACDISKFCKFCLKFCKFCLEESIKVACPCIKYSLRNLHKYSVYLKLRLI